MTRNKLAAARLPLPFRLATIAIAMTTLASCAVFRWQPDMSARAPKLDGFGVIDMPITSRSNEARRLYAQGIAQAYAFDEVESIRDFKAALAQDADCAMCAWGVAWQLGPNINNTVRRESAEALRYVGYALEHSAGITERERGLIEALAVRYGQGDREARNAAVIAAAVCTTGGAKEQADPLDIAYADRMRALADRYPDDADIVALYAEAELIATRDDWWNDATDRPNGRIGEVATRLEAALVKHPDHTGLNHYLIHTTDAPRIAVRAEQAADRLGRLAPNSPHLVHMPSHTYSWTGRYADATRVNQQALVADEALTQTLKQQSFDTAANWRGHNARFLWFAAVMEGRGDLAMETSRSNAARSEKADNEFGELTRSGPVLTLMRLERWQAVLDEPLPSGEKGVAAVLGPFARGVAQARLGQVAAAKETLSKLEPASAALLKAHAGSGYFDKMARALGQTATQRLGAEVALADGRLDAAVALQTEAVASAKEIEEAEIPVLGAGTRVALGEMQIKAGRWADADATFLAHLRDRPADGWALRGLARSLAGEGLAAEAAQRRGELARVWASADANLQVLR